MATTEVWHLSRDGQSHQVTLSGVDLRRHLAWSVDGEVVAEATTGEEKARLTAPGRGTVLVAMPKLGTTARRVRLAPATAEGENESLAAFTGVGAIDFDPEPGSKAARRSDWIVAHPRLFQVRTGIVAVLGVVLPVALVWLLVRLATTIPWPRIDLPDLPSIPWPDLPSIPWPDITLPAWSLPGWVDPVLDAAKLVLPVLVALALARAEVRRRRHQEEERRQVADDPRDTEPTQPDT